MCGGQQITRGEDNAGSDSEDRPTGSGAVDDNLGVRGTSERGTGGGLPSVGALEDVYRTNVSPVYGYAAVRLGRAEGEDVTSEVFQAAAYAFADGRFEQVTPAWLMAVTRNKVIDRWRRAERRMAKAHLLDDFGNAPDPLDLSLDHERRDQVLDVLSNLNERHRMLLVLHYLEGQSAPDIAESLDESTLAIESALARARRRFRTIYEGRTAS